jgi:hypothetical protein
MLIGAAPAFLLLEVQDVIGKDITDLEGVAVGRESAGKSATGGLPPEGILIRKDTAGGSGKKRVWDCQTIWQVKVIRPSEAEGPNDPIIGLVAHGALVEKLHEELSLDVVIELCCLEGGGGIIPKVPGIRKRAATVFHQISHLEEGKTATHEVGEELLHALARGEAVRTP